MDMLEAAERVFVTIGAPSQLGTALVSTAIKSAGFQEETPSYGQAAAMMGYACRMAQGREVPVEIVAVIHVQLPRGTDGRIDNEHLAEDPEKIGRLLEYLAEMAHDREAIAALAGCSLGAWHGFSATGTMQLHKNLVKNGLSRRQLLSEETVENLLRLGYSLRVMDEVAGEEPLAKGSVSVVLAVDHRLDRTQRIAVDEGWSKSSPEI
ncbi:MAG TPA: hypothetical protein VLJ42_05200 [Solirubrobacteraceae bacterium]|nr:hypothetical protein [Solirubrobacteraceae bacterium]